MQCYVIALQNNPHSQALLTDCLASCRKWGWSAEPYWAVVGSDITPVYFENIGLYLNPNTKIAGRPGAQGCFLSHWNLWNLCVQKNSPIVVLESDAVIQGAMPVYDPGGGIQKFHTDRGTKTGFTGTWSKGAHAYALAPKHAQALIQGITDTEVKPADKCIGTRFVPWQHLAVDLVKLNPRRGPSTTARLHTKTQHR